MQNKQLLNTEITGDCTNVELAELSDTEIELMFEEVTEVLPSFVLWQRPVSYMPH